MAVLEWSPALSVNIQEIDLQHRQLVELVAALRNAHSTGAAKDIMVPVIRRLNDYVREHFTAEERWMERYGYPELAEHRKLHDAFINTILHFELDFLNDRSEVSGELLDFLEQWLVLHVTGADQRYAAFFAEDGLL